MGVLNDAIVFATAAHDGQIRKMTGTPYILHPLEVAAIISTVTDDERVMAAGVLHDTVEDCGVLPETIRERFGSRVFALVQSDSEDKMADRPASETWLERKQDSLLMLEHTKDRDAKIMWLGDKLSNMRSLRQGYDREGETVFLHFHQHDPKMHGWYYHRILKLLAELSDTEAYRELREHVHAVFGPEEILL